MNAAQTIRDSCPESKTIHAFLQGHLEPFQRQSVAVHLTECGGCALIARQLDASPEAAAGSTALATGGSSTPLPADVAKGLADVANTVAFVPAVKPAFLGPYRIGERIGQGGMGTVYRAEHVRLKKWFAVKILPAAQGTNSHAVDRFTREMEVVGRLNHPNIVRATDAGEIDGRHFLVMELIEGADLARLVGLTGPLPVAEACEIIRQAALGLQHAHEHGLVHRDLKPHNLMLTPAGEVKMLDLGLAFFLTAVPPADGLTWDGQVMGTPAYMAPEQWRDSHAIDTRADVYSLGCSLYYLLTGRPPVDSTDRDVLLTERPQPLALAAPDLPPADVTQVEGLLARVLAKDPADRPQTPADLACELTPLAADADLTDLCETSFRLSNYTHALTTPLPSPMATRKQTTRKGRAKPPSQFRRRAVIVALCALLIAVTAAWWTGLTLPTNVGTSTAGTIEPVAGLAPVPGVAPPAPAPAPGPVVPEVNRWFKLLDKADRPPTPILWDNRDARSAAEFKAGLQQFDVKSVYRGLWKLHRVESPSYMLKVTTRQLPWTGGVGVFLGGYRDPETNVLTYHSIELRSGHLGINRSPIVHRAQHTKDFKKNPPLDSLEEGWATDAPILPLAPRDYTLEVRVAGDRITSVWWDGVYLKSLADGRQMPPNFRSYMGDVGVYVHGGSATFVSAELLLTE